MRGALFAPSFLTSAKNHLFFIPLDWYRMKTSGKVMNFWKSRPIHKTFLNYASYDVLILLCLWRQLDEEQEIDIPKLQELTSRFRNQKRLPRGSTVNRIFPFTIFTEEPTLFCMSCKNNVGKSFFPTNSPKKRCFRCGFGKLLDSEEQRSHLRRD